jgi:hypothetical protein
VGTRPARRSTETELDLVVVAGTETGWPATLLVLKKSVRLWNASDRTDTAGLILIDKE